MENTVIQNSNVGPSSENKKAAGGVYTGIVLNAPHAAVTSCARILRLPEVMARIGLKRSSIYQLMLQGAFPRQISLGARAVGWLEHEIDAWLAARIAGRCA